jgi:hypothetical protein
MTTPGTMEASITTLSITIERRDAECRFFVYRYAECSEILISF